MDILQIALIFLIALLTVFLTVTGVQVFFILRDLKKALDKLSRVLQTGQEIAQEVEKPMATAVSLVSALGTRAKALTKFGKKDKKPKSKRFYKKVL